MEMRKNKMKKKLTHFGTLLILVVTTSCCSPGRLVPPYLLLEHYVEIGEREPDYSIAGACFILYNNSERAIKSCTISFRLYDADGMPCGIGPNSMVNTFNVVILPHQKQQLVVRLDDSLGAEVEDEYQIDYTCVTNITYEDNSQWTDALGLYAW